MRPSYCAWEQGKHFSLMLQGHIFSKQHLISHRFIYFFVSCFYCNTGLCNEQHDFVAASHQKSSVCIGQSFTKQYAKKPNSQVQTGSKRMLLAESPLFNNVNRCKQSKKKQNKKKEKKRLALLMSLGCGVARCNE